jgi:hypothetical protein
LKGQSQWQKPCIGSIKQTALLLQLQQPLPLHLQEQVELLQVPAL